MPDMKWVTPDNYSHNSTLYWIIVEPGGDRSRLTVAEMGDGTSYEEADYALASRQRFRDEQEANDYCAQLAREHGKVAEIEGFDILD
jgi:hypothetical protein